MNTRDARAKERREVKRVMVTDIYQTAVYQFLPPEYVQAAGTIAAQIGAVYQEEGNLGFGRKERLVMEFSNGVKTLILNKTNAALLAEWFGRNPQQWRGQWVTLYVLQINVGGSQKLSICVRRGKSGKADAGSGAAGADAGAPVDAGADGGAAGVDTDAPVDAPLERELRAAIKAGLAVPVLRADLSLAQVKQAVSALGVAQRMRDAKGADAAQAFLDKALAAFNGSR